MSRAYRITVKESVTRDIAAGDCVGTRLELLDILPPEAMGRLLRDELIVKGFTETDDGTLIRKDGSVTVSVDPCSGEVNISSEAAKTVTVAGTKDAQAYDDVGPKGETVAEKARKQLRADLEKKITGEKDKLQAKASIALEKHLHDLQPELGRIVNKVTREALKQKAAQMGSIVEIAEDEQSGSMSIKVEV